jgi:hypothetical protein
MAVDNARMSVDITLMFVAPHLEMTAAEPAARPLVAEATWNPCHLGDRPCRLGDSQFCRAAA